MVSMSGSPRLCVAAAMVFALGLSACGAAGGSDTQQESGITDDQVVIGTSTPLSGPNAAYGVMAKSLSACFDYVNEEKKGVTFADGKTRRIKHVMYDDAMEPARSVQNARRLISQDKIFAMVGAPGTGANLGSREFYNQQKVPQIFVGSGGPEFGDEVQQFPWSSLAQPAYNTEASIYATYISQAWPGAKIGLLNDDSGGPHFADGFLKAADEIGLEVVIHEEYSNAEATIDAKIDKIRQAGVDVFVDASTPKFAVQSLKRVKALDWDVKHVLWYVGASVGGVLRPAGSAASTGVYSALWLKDYSNPSFADDEDVTLYAEKLGVYDKGLDPADMNAAQGWYVCHAFVSLLEKSEPTRESLMKNLRSMDQLAVPLLMDGVTLTTDGETDGFPVESLQMAQFDGTSYRLLGEVISFEGKTPPR